jgi:hypothetical protein
MYPYNYQNTDNPQRNTYYAQTPVRQQQATRRLPPMSKAHALDLVETFKRWIVVISILIFGVLTALVLGNMPKTNSTSQATPAASSTVPANSQVPASTNSGSGGFFQPQQGGYGFGGSTQQGPVSSSSAS